MIEPPNSVLLLVSRESFTPPSTFGAEIAVATADCIAVGTLSVDDGPTLATVTATSEEPELIELGSFSLETEGFLSIRDVYNREYETVGVDVGRVVVRVMGNDVSEPSRVVFVTDPV